MSLDRPFMNKEMPLERLIQRDILFCPPNLSVSEAARRMVDKRCSSILVQEGGEVIGIWTEHDALSIDFGNPANFDRPVSEAMSSPVKSIPEGITLGEAVGRFHSEQVRHFLVVDAAGAAVGVVSQTDVVLNQGIEYYLRLLAVSAVVAHGPLSLDASTPLEVVMRRMREERADAVVMLEKGKATGILTERDTVRLVAERKGGCSLGEVASRPLVTVDGEASLFHVRDLLTQRGIRHVAVTDAAHELVGVVGFSDLLASAERFYVEELKAALIERNNALNISRRNLRLAEKVIECSLEGIVITDLDGIIISVNPAFTRVTGFDAEEAVGQNVSLLNSGRHDPHFYRQMWQAIREDGLWQGEIWNRRKGGEVFPELLTITVIPDETGTPTHYAAIFSDISVLKESEQRIEALAYYDTLTGLPNQMVFKDRLSVALFKAHSEKRRAAVMMIGLDRFQRVNESLGHHAGDELLRQVARRLRECVSRDTDLVARMGADEYLLLLDPVGHTEEAVRTAWMIVEAFQNPFIIDGNEVHMTVSIGISLFPEDGNTPEVLMMNADAAMYRTKGDARSSFQLYTASMNASAAVRLAMEGELRRALEEGQFEVYYQPIMGPGDGKLCAAEALLRWHHPERGMVSPEEFIPVAEDSGMIIALGEWVLREVCQTLAHCTREGRKPVPVAVNISGLQFRDGDFMVMVKSILRESGVDPELLRFELTESVIMDHAEESIAMLREIRDLGIRISVDDFGTGYSSLAYLKRFPISVLKVDRSFIKDLTVDHDDAAIVHTIITLAHAMRLKVVAEGVEEREQIDVLLSEHCDYVQGFYYSRPLPAAEYRDKFL